MGVSGQGEDLREMVSVDVDEKGNDYLYNKAKLLIGNTITPE